MIFVVPLLIVLNVDLISSNNCYDFKTCGECIGNSLTCVWCSAEKHSGPRCDLAAEVDKKNDLWCDGTVYNPSKEFITSKDKPFQSGGTNGEKSVQFRPQALTIKARPGDTVSFNISYKPANDYPLDIYYLMDNSFTMGYHKKKIQENAHKIYDALSKLTNNVQFGVGSYVEKPDLPYADPTQNVYAFRNDLPLTDDIMQFEKVVTNIRSHGNYDDPEAALDGLMQVMVCKDIKWREEARRILILSTDATYHSAGDGKMIGTLLPNDMKCHLEDNTYEEKASLLYDYPSVSQINKIASEKQISIIFSVLPAVKDVYIALGRKVQGASYVSLTNNSSIVDMIAEEYLKLVQNLEVKESYVPNFIELKLHPLCTKEKKCEVKHNGHVEITATITIKACPVDNNYNNVLEIGPVGLRERLAVNLEAQCQCECEKAWIGKANSKNCNLNGAYQCGVCKCNENSYGETCECLGTSTEALDIEKCKANKNDTIICSGQGTCRCGKCDVCKKNYYGDFCQFSCGDHGSYEAKGCVCEAGWTADDCSCSTDKSTCKGYNGKECSGNGYCHCGQCICEKVDSKNNKYYGEFCNVCEECNEERCKELQPYVECYYATDKSTCDEKFNQTVHHEVQMYSKTKINASESEGYKLCLAMMDDGSAIVFRYTDILTKQTLIKIQNEKEVPPGLNIWIPVASSIGAILLIGLITVLVWKILVDIHDGREYKKFVKESQERGYEASENPLYQPPAVSINNPAYNENI